MAHDPFGMIAASEARATIAQANEEMRTVEKGSVDYLRIMATRRDAVTALVRLRAAH